MEKKVQGPAIGLIVLGILGALSSIVGMFMGGIDAQMLIDAGFPEEEARKFAEALATGGTAVRLIMNAAGVLAGGFVAWSGFQMLKLRAWTACVVASILVMVPCTSCCCVIGVPIGIWGLVVLFDATVKQAFQAAAGGGVPPPSAA